MTPDKLDKLAREVYKIYWADIENAAWKKSSIKEIWRSIVRHIEKNLGE